MHASLVCSLNDSDGPPVGMKNRGQFRRTCWSGEIIWAAENFLEGPKSKKRDLISGPLLESLTSHMQKVKK